MASLTKSQQLVYDYLCSTMAERAVPPSVREICAATGLRSTSTVHSHLKSLEALGYITRDAGLNRSIHIVGASAAKQVPILGKVTAGLPILAVEDIEGYIPYPDKSGKELFALHVDGLSMINAGILDGDYVIAEKTPVAENGEIVVGMIGDEATVKYFRQEGSLVVLTPKSFNPVHQPQIYDLKRVQVRVVGLVVECRKVF